MEPQDTPVASADIFHHYRVLRREDGSLWKLGSGGMGTTYKAIDNNLDALVALKVISATLLDLDPFARDRFIREAKTAAALRHRNAATVYHLGLDSQSYFYAMEFIAGETVDERVKRVGPFTVSAALALILQAARALGAAHRLGMVHRDIKPANLMLIPEHEDDGEGDLLKLIDFGLAKSLGTAAPGHEASQQSQTFFTPAYASPEQCQEIPTDIRGDLYSLGVTLWFMLTGQPTFRGRSTYNLQRKHISDLPPMEELAAAEVPAVVQNLLGWMLAKAPGDRPQTPFDLRREIETCQRFLAGKAMAGDVFQAPAPPAIDGTPNPGDVSEHTSAPAPAVLTPGKFPLAARRKIIRASAAAAISLLVAGGFGAYYFSSDSRPAASQPAAGAQPARPPSTGPHLVPQQFKTIQAAIDAAQPGEIVRVQAGRYPEALRFKAGILLVGEGADRAVVVCPPGAGGALWADSCASGWISDLGFESPVPGPGQAEVTGIHLSGSKVSVRRCRVRLAGNSGILCDGGDHSTVQDCEVTACRGQAVTVTGKGTSTLLNSNRIHHNAGDGIDYEAHCSARAEGNICDNNVKAGIKIDNYAYASLVGNFVRGNRQDGIAFHGSSLGRAERNVCERNTRCGLWLRSSHVTIDAIKNQARENVLCGIAFSGGLGGLVEGNLCEKNGGAGIFVKDSLTNPVVRANTCQDNSGYGLQVDDTASPAVEDDNVLLRNKTGPYFVGPAGQAIPGQAASRP